MLLGVNLTLLIGPTIAVTVTPDIAEAVRSVQVTQSDEGRSGFQVVLQVGRAGPTDLLDYRLLQNPILRPFNRVLLNVTFNGLPRTLMDGVITNQQFAPGNQPGAATLTLTGEDVSVLMDLEKKRAEHPSESETQIAEKLIRRYSHLGLVPDIVPPPSIDQPSPTERTPVQQGTDLDYLKQMATRFGYVFYIEPGPLPGKNRAYWGPPIRRGLPQSALSVNLGPETNVDSINFTYNGLAPTLVVDEFLDKQTNQKLPIVTFASTRVPPLVSRPAIPFQLPNVRTSLAENAKGRLSYAQALIRAQALTDRSIDSVVTASGELNALNYGGLLKPRGLVGLRGVGDTYSGLYYVKSVSHAISRGQYKQRFTLSREGTGTLSPMVIP